MKTISPSFVSVSYAYPTSPAATKAGHGRTGCYFLNILRENSMMAAPVHSAVFSSEADAAGVAMGTGHRPAYWHTKAWQEANPNITGVALLES